MTFLDEIVYLDEIILLAIFEKNYMVVEKPVISIQLSEI